MFEQLFTPNIEAEEKHLRHSAQLLREVFAQLKL